jgi:tRNA 2-selenouridine synthase
VQLLLEDYGFFAQDVGAFCQLLDGLVALRGKDTVARWQAQARAGAWAEVFADMMRLHYDPLYNRSMDRHYASYAQAQPVLLADGGPPSLHSTAQALLASTS